MTQGRLETLKILVLIALRNLFASRLKTLIIGGIICFGTILVLVGTSLLDSINAGMKSSIIGSLAGDLQLYHAESKDELALYGGMTGDVDLKAMEDFSKVKQVVAAVPNVKAVVPMGIAEAFASSGNYFDQALERLRAAEKERARGAEQEAVYQARKAHVRRQIELLHKDFENARAMVDEKAIDPVQTADRARAASEEFWAKFDQAPLENLEYLENRIAPQALDGDMLWVRYAGTDLKAYFDAFERAQLIQGERIPDGQRGMYMGSVYYEDWIKMKNAWRLDKIREARSHGRQIAKDEELQRFVKENVTQVRDIVVQLDPLKAQAVTERIQKALGSEEKDLMALLGAFFQTTDENFDQRYETFYAQVAPLVDLYKVRVGDTITIKAFTKSGYMKSVNVKVWGIVQFKGLEKSAFAGMMSLMDIMTFRDLYGFVTADKAAEIKDLKQAAGAAEIKREDAEAALFGGDAPLVADAKPQAIDEGLEIALQRPDPSSRVYTPEEIEQGVALNAAIVLKDPTRAIETRRDIEAALAKAGLKIKVIDWQKAAGMVGQLITVLRLVLVVAVLIIFAIALVIINNAMVIATLQRIKEIGTIRALGAQRRFVLGMVGVETVVVGLLFGLVGTALGAGIVALINHYGIPATSQEAYFFFSGPRLHPWFTAGNLIMALSIVFVVSLLSAFYPAVLATRITPLEAMQSEE